jgi:hypothetical protein
MDNVDLNNSMIECKKYNYKIMDFLIPPLISFYKLCTSNDKTYLFIIGAVRCMIIGFLIKTYHDVFVTEDKIFQILVIYGIINMLLLVLTMLKKTDNTIIS